MTPRKTNNDLEESTEDAISAGWGDKWAHVRGYNATIVALFVVGVGLLWYSDIQQRERITEIAERIESKAVSRYDTIIINQAKILAAISAQNDEAARFRQEWIFIQTLDERQKRELHLEVPSSLAPRIRR